MKPNYILITAITLCIASMGFAQEQKIWVSGAARAVMYGDKYNTDAENDTTTARKLESGHAMVDLGTNIQPNDNVLIKAMVRIRNDYGGFWGSGVTFDVRQLYMKGIIGGFLRYQLGDIDYRMTPYTFHNNTGLVNQFAGVMSSVPLDQVRYDVFYMDDNTWRQQGAAVDFALEFDQYIKEIEFNGFATRTRPTNFSTQDDRIYSGGSVILKQGKFNLGGQYANLFDLIGTSDNTMYFRNPVITGTAEISHEISRIDLNAAVETGRSRMEWQNDTNAPTLEDYFYDIRLKASSKKYGLTAEVGYRDVGANFRSAGAQTMQLNYARAPLAYDRYGNAQLTRQIGLMDINRDASLYNMQISEQLAVYDPRYDNATPYGRATPNRKGFSTMVGYENPEEKWKFKVNADLLSDVVGQGTAALKSYGTYTADGEVRIDKFLGWDKRKIQLNAMAGMQQTSRSGQEAFEEVDLASTFATFSLTSTIHKELELIAEYRLWQTNGSDQLAERNTYTQIIDYSEYNIDYNESILGAGIQFAFSDDIHLRGMWQRFEFQDNQDLALPYNIDTWTIFFTMKF